MFRLFLIGSFFILSACQSRPYSHVEVSEGYPRGRKCNDVGQVIGNAQTRDGAREQAMEDLRRNAARLDANYVRLIAVTSHGNAARGIAYRCQ